MRLLFGCASLFLGAAQAALGVAFVVEGLLLGFHLKGTSLEVVVHKILVITIALSALIMFAEIRSRASVMLTVARALLVILQGIWFIQIGYILYMGARLARKLASSCRAGGELGPRGMPVHGILCRSLEVVT